MQWDLVDVKARVKRVKKSVYFFGASSTAHKLNKFVILVMWLPSNIKKLTLLAKMKMLPNLFSRYN